VSDEDDIADVTGRFDLRRLPPNVRVGQDVWIERRMSFERFRSARDPGIVLGDRVRVYTWTTFNVEPTGVVEVGDDSVLVGPVFMVVDSVRVGKNVVLSYGVTIADSDFHPLDPVARRRDVEALAPGGRREDRAPLVARPVVIEDDVRIGIGAIVLKGVRVGRGAHVGAGAVVTADVAPGATVLGNPAAPVGGRRP
jgi:acetyltransferase-like isoleucine patch superfamily enzyme